MTEEWLPIIDFPDYFVSNQGRVKSTKRKGDPIILKPWLARGYPTVSLSRDGVMNKFQVHTLVLNAFVGPCPEGMLCLHEDNDPTNNSLTNLHWVHTKRIWSKWLMMVGLTNTLSVSLLQLKYVR